MSAFAGRRFTVVTQFYWPEHVGIAPYSTRLAEHLVALGATVDVITAMPHYPEWRIAPEYKGLLQRRELHEGVTVHRLWHYIPPRQSAVRRAAYEATLWLHAMGRRAPASDAVIGVIPSLSTGAIAREYARRTSSRYGIVIQDLSAQGARQSGIAGGGAVASATSRVEGWVLSGAARVAVVSPRFQPHVEGFGVAPDRISVLRNWVEVDEDALASMTADDIRAIRASHGWGDDEVIVLHAGNMGLKQGLEHVVDAGRLASERRLPVRFVLMGDGSQRPMIEARANGVAGVQFIPSQPRHVANRMMAAADVLLVNERGSIVDMALPSKLTSYFAARKPVLAAVADGGTTAEEVQRSGGGLIVPPEDPESLLAAVQKVATDATLASGLSERGATYAQRELSAEATLRQAERFVEALIE